MIKAIQKILVLITTLFLFHTSYGQKDNFDHCASLQKILQDTLFDRQFHFLSDTNIILVDRAKYFNNCNVLTPKGKVVIITDTCAGYLTIQRDMLTQQKMMKNDLNKLVVAVTQLEQGVVQLHFWNPCSNGDILYELRKSSNKTLIKVLGYGNY